MAGNPSGIVLVNVPFWQVKTLLHKYFYAIPISRYLYAFLAT